jgi:hypothetical protein
MSKIFEGLVKSTENSINEDLRKWFKEKWVRFGPDGKIRGDCARGDDSEGKPKCLPQSKAHSLGKKGRASAAARKRREDPNPERSGKAINVATKKKSNEGISEEQLDELKCWSGYTRVQGVPAGAPGSCKKKTDETVEEGLTKQARAKKEAEAIIAVIKRLESELKDPNPYIDREDIQRRLDTEKRRLELYRDVLDEQDIKEEKCPHCAGPMFSEALMMEKKDACYYKVKSRYKVWPSAYASGALVKCRKKGAKNWGTKSESAIMRGIQNEQDVEESMSSKNIDVSNLVPGKQVTHGLLGTVTVVKIENGGLIVKDSHGKQYRISLTSVK